MPCIIILLDAVYHHNTRCCASSYSVIRIIHMANVRVKGLVVPKTRDVGSRNRDAVHHILLGAVYDTL